MDRLTSMAAFVSAVERGGFAAAAEQFGVSPTMIGLHVRSLEDRLGSRLLNRTTRRQSLTEVGHLFYERCKQILIDVEAAEASASELRSVPRGRLRVTAPVSFGAHALAPAITDYLALYPEVEIDLALNDRVVDLVEEGYEIAIRTGPLADSALIARPLAAYRSLICTSPDYLERYGEPRNLADLSRHNCLGFAYWRSGKEWRLIGADGEHSVPVRGSFHTNNGEALRLAALNGLGIILQPEVLLAADVEAGRLVKLLKAYTPPSQPMHVLYLPDRRRTPKLVSFIDFLVARFGDRQP
jgi:DNA-binding transcriptional LysR family regulator